MNGISIIVDEIWFTIDKLWFVVDELWFVAKETRKKGCLEGLEAWLASFPFPLSFCTALSATLLCHL